MKVDKLVVGDEEYVLGQVLDNGSVVTLLDLEEHEDGSVVQTMEATHESGAVDTTRSFVPAPEHPMAIEWDLTTKLEEAMVDNVTVLGELAGMDEAALREHVGSLTRQVNALIRMVLRRFDDSTGT